MKDSRVPEAMLRDKATQDFYGQQKLRERTGAFYTPRIWVELSQKYIAAVLGEHWQDEYYVWDCAAGTGNLLAGLTNKNNIWASTLDNADVEVMHDRIKDGANLLKDHVFPFDFLNDDFTTLPKDLQNVINDEQMRKKMILYINPPYAEAGSTATRLGTKENKTGVATGNKIHTLYSERLGNARNEVFAQFLVRIYCEISGCLIAEFSTQKVLVAPNFKEFRTFFRAQLQTCFIVPAQTFDNVKGQFPIGFKFWDTKEENRFTRATVNVYDANARYLGKKTYAVDHDRANINDWIRKYRSKSLAIGKLCYVANDFQNNIKTRICSLEQKILAHDVIFNITRENLILASIYFAVRKIMKPTWLNDRDQFFSPDEGWQTDKNFQSDCLAFTLFNNNIQSQYGINHWIPFTESEVQARSKFESNFMSDFIAGKIAMERFFLTGSTRNAKKSFCFSSEAKGVFAAGRELWRYYHMQTDVNINAGIYDIREYFQGRNFQGRMNAKSTDAVYTELIGNLRSALKILAAKIVPKVYQYGFLKE